MNTLYKLIFAAPAAVLIGLSAPLASHAGTFSKLGTEEAALQNCYPQPPKYVTRRLRDSARER